MGSKLDKFQIIDSHTGGEPTRVVIDKIPGIESGNMSELRDEFAVKCDWLRTSLLSEPRGFEAMVGALLLDSEEPDCEAGVIFFNNKGVLKGCLHGTMGLVKTLEFMGRITYGVHSIETPVGIVKAELLQDGSVQVANVPSHRYLSDVEIELQDYGVVRGDIAWGGNWFYLIEGFGPEVNYSNIEELSSFSVDVMNELERSGITGEDGSKVDHVEIFGPPSDSSIADSKNFVMCPGGEYDRSPCGTGTSAKLACLYDSGKLKEGETWRQAGILDTVFEGQVTHANDGSLVPSVRGSAWVNGQYELTLDPSDPFRYGIS